jgi:hypothetical protein
VVEEQVEVVVAPVDHHALLAGDEGETRSQLDEEALHLVEDRVLQVRLAVLRRQSEEVVAAGVKLSH